MLHATSVTPSRSLFPRRRKRRNRCRREGRKEKVGNEGANRSTKARLGNDSSTLTVEVREAGEAQVSWLVARFPSQCSRVNSRGQRIKITQRIEGAISIPARMEAEVDSWLLHATIAGEFKNRPSLYATSSAFGIRESCAWDGIVFSEDHPQILPFAKK